MINVNGTLADNDVQLSVSNRGFAFGDAVFETLKVVDSNILFWEDHYFRLMASMRILRMEIPMQFTMEFLEQQILKTIEANAMHEGATRVRFTVFRDGLGLYAPQTNEVGYAIKAQALEFRNYQFNAENYRVDLFKDFAVSPGLLSTLKTNNKALNVVGSVYAKENDLDNSILMNTNKQVVEALNANLFLVQGNVVKTPPLLDGCIKGVMRKQVMDCIKVMDDLTLEEISISPFELQRADELFLTNVIMGIKPITDYRKKTFQTSIASRLTGMINEKLGI